MPGIKLEVVDGFEWVGVVHIVMHLMRRNSVVFVLAIVIVLLGDVVVVIVIVLMTVVVVVAVVVVVIVVVAVVVVVPVFVWVDAGMPLCAVCNGMLEGEGGKKFSVGVMGWVVVQWCF